MTLKIGSPSGQQRLPGVTDTTAIVDEFMTLMGLLNEGDLRRIEEVIPDRAYRTNFIHLGRRLAPDGKDLTLVGFTVMRDGRERFLEVTTPRSEIPCPDTVGEGPPADAQSVTVRGVLRFADATHAESGQIKIVDEASGTTHIVKVPEEMMGDIVRPLWESQVIVTGKKTGRNIVLEDIEEILENTDEE